MLVYQEHKEPDIVSLSWCTLLYLCTELCCLEITPDDKQIVLVKGSSLTLSCSGTGETTWEFKKEDTQTQVQNDGESYKTVQSNATSTALTLLNVNWSHTGVYQCFDRHATEIKEVAVFVPVPEGIDAYVNASKTVLKEGESLTVNCTVHGVQLVYFSWDFPNKEVDVEPLTDILSSMNMRSCLIFPVATVAHSGDYICHVHESVQGHTASASVNITLLCPLSCWSLSPRVPESIPGRDECPAPLKEGTVLKEDNEQEVTYADVRIMQQQGRQLQQTAEVEVEYGQVRFSGRPQQTVKPSGDDCVYAKVHRDS
ncbi:hypothetical protein Q8A73_010758 [Channa argus]|nr:hypothetical protein Q8A73_010758 [Channa argus]